jgi:predicted cupin superfamily sugar epimerase
MNADAVVQLLRLEPIPLEGGYFRRTWTTDQNIGFSGTANLGCGQPMGTVIYALFTQAQFSAMHRLRSDEVWHFYAGDPVDLLLLWPGGESRHFRLGPDLAGGELPQCVVPAGVWQGARPTLPGVAGWSLVGCSMSPGFVPADFELGERKYLKSKYSDQSEWIDQLTRDVIIGQ